MPTDEEIKAIYERSRIKTDKIRVAATNPALKEKIRINLDDGADEAVWYMQFNTPLDPESVSRKTMNVTEVNGYILKTDISYDASKNMIILRPVDSYAQNEFYLLNVSQKVRSEKGRNLEKEIHILFKLTGNQISEFKTLKSSVTVPKPKPRPRNYVMEGTVPEKPAAIAYGRIKLNPAVGIMGLVLTIIGLLTSLLYISAAGGIVALLGIVHIAVQAGRPQVKSQIVYNHGVMLKNWGKEAGARRKFTRSVGLDPLNMMAKQALAECLPETETGGKNVK